MFSAVSDWLFNSGLTPHGFCLLWNPGLVWTYAISDAGIGLAYFSIPVALAVIARNRRDLVFSPLLWLFAAFILLCGTTHWIDVLTLWIPAYGFGAVVRVATALTSIFTAIALWMLLPEAVTFPTPEQMREANAELKSAQERLQQAQKMEIVGQLTGGVAHDFNNMAQAVSGGLTLLERRIAAQRYLDLDRLIGDMRRTLDAASGITNRLLAFSRRQALHPTHINPNQFVGGMRDFLQRTIGPGIRLRLQLGGAENDIVCDSHQLEAALLNLAINARDAMPQGGELIVSVLERSLGPKDLLASDQAEPGPYVEIRVADTGTGMGPDVVAGVRALFYDQAERPGNGARALAGLRVRPAVGRLLAHRKRPRRRNFGVHVFSRSSPRGWRDCLPGPGTGAARSRQNGVWFRPCRGGPGRGARADRRGAYGHGLRSRRGRRRAEWTPNH